MDLQDAGGSQGLQKDLAMGICHLAEWHPDITSANAQGLQCHLCGNGIGLQKEVSKERIISVLKFLGSGEIPRKIAVYQLLNFGGNQVRGHADHSDSPGGHERQGKGVISRKDLKGRWESGPKLINPLDTPSGLLDGDDVRTIGGQSGHNGDGNLDPASARDAVENDWNGDGIGHRLEVSVEAFRGGLVIVRSHLKGGIGPQSFRLKGQVHRLGSGVGSRACDDQNPSVGSLNGQFYYSPVLFVAEGGGLSRGSHGNDSGNACGDLTLDQAGQGHLIQGTVFLKGSDQRGMGAGKGREGHGKSEALNRNG